MNVSHVQCHANFMVVYLTRDSVSYDDRQSGQIRCYSLPFTKGSPVWTKTFGRRVASIRIGNEVTLLSIATGESVSRLLAVQNADGKYVKNKWYPEQICYQPIERIGWLWNEELLYMHSPVSDGIDIVPLNHAERVIMHAYDADMIVEELRDNRQALAMRFVGANWMRLIISSNGTTRTPSEGRLVLRITVDAREIAFIQYDIDHVEAFRFASDRVVTRHDVSFRVYYIVDGACFLRDAFSLEFIPRSFVVNSKSQVAITPIMSTGVGLLTYCNTQIRALDENLTPIAMCMNDYHLTTVDDFGNVKSILLKPPPPHTWFSRALGHASRLQKVFQESEN